MSDFNLFSANPLDRAFVQRRDPDWLAARLEDPQSRFLPLWQLKVLVRKDDGALAWARGAVRASMDEEVGVALMGVRGDVAHFAVDISPVADPEETLGFGRAASFEDVRLAAMQMPAEEAGMVAQARALIDWHSNHRFCACCGAPTKSASGGAMRVCSHCKVEHFPRVNPVAIMVVVREDRCLLGRQNGWPEGMFSALAGFIEPGETIEEAVRREVREESGVVIGEVRYLASQPWPFPSSLMIGCIAEAETEVISMDPVELEDVRWFERDTVLKTLAFDPQPDLILPPPIAIGHQLVKVWAEGG